MPRVLIVDDAMFMRMSIKMMFEKNGFEVVDMGCDGKEAVEKYKQHQPDIVTMDVTMPNMTGTEAVKEIKNFDPKAKIIMVSAMGQEPMVKEAIINGASYFVVKPFKEENFIDIVKNVLHK